MKKIFFVFLFFIQLISFAQQKDLLSGKFTQEQLKTIMISQSAWKPFPPISDRDAWAKADQRMMTAYITTAETYLTYQWPSVPATKSLLIDRTGDRYEYETISFKKREVLGTLLLAEIAENKGRFVDQIVDGVWSICEESFWGASAHIPQKKEFSGLADVSAPFVELFSAETATFLAWTDYFLGYKFDAISPQIRKRIYYETNNRIFQPMMNNSYSWMGYRPEERRPNNWNPWICSNWINAALLLERDEAKRTAMIYKALDVLDEFLNPYPLDGGCDEGPGYWGVAAASLYDNISLLNLATNNSFQYVFKEEKIRNMGKFIYRTQISEKYFVNFADASPQPSIAANMVYRFGKDIQDDAMMKFGAYYRKPETGQIGKFTYFRNFFSLFMQDEFEKEPQALPFPKDFWFPDLQVAIARDQEGTTQGFFIAAQGGHNDESHNHNDVGNYIVYYDGYPLIIDVGSGTYTRKTFSSQRYDIWYNCSNYHNVPTVNGKDQLAGRQYEATQVAYKQDMNFSEMSLDLSKAYPKDAGILSLKRVVHLNRGKNVVLEDNLKVSGAASYTQHFMTSYPVTIEKSGAVIMHYKNETGLTKDFTIQYKADQLEASVEKVTLGAPEDVGVKEKWGDNIYRISFKAKAPKSTDKFIFQISPK